MSLPKIETVPLVGVKYPPKIDKRVDFPAPGGPEIMINSSSSISRSIPFNKLFSESDILTI
jgi:hypothetical protein